MVIVDTAGRLHVDAGDDGRDQAPSTRAVNPLETLFVVDTMTGQDAANTAKAFHEALPLTGVILTKTDGDARGGAALSIRQITGAPIKFLGVGEKTGALEPFHPERVASRILGMGDVLSLVEEVQRNVDQDTGGAAGRQARAGQGLRLQRFSRPAQQMGKHGRSGQSARQAAGHERHQCRRPAKQLGRRQADRARRRPSSTP